jgi:HK97 family phage portal protein
MQWFKRSTLQQKKVLPLDELPVARQATSMEIVPLRSHPAQKAESAMWMYAPTPDIVPLMVQFALNNWVYKAVSYLATLAASANLFVVDRATELQRFEDHGLLRLIGKYGAPNDQQDSFEFLEKHFTYLDLAGNSYWYWYAGADGLPGEVHLLEPERVMIVPGRDLTVENYVYRAYGGDVELSPEEVTHFRRPNPFSRYYGLSALQSLYGALQVESGILRWNAEFFGDSMAVPGGILVVPDDVSDAELVRIKAEFVAKHGGKREVAIVRAAAGSTTWLDAGLKPRDVDFSNGRLLTRQAVYEVLDLPAGVLSESSTEAHAVVAQRMLYEAVEVRHLRTVRKLNADALGFWPRARTLAAKFEDVKKRATDWRRESLRINTIAKFFSVDEIRMAEFGAPPMADNEEVASGTGNKRQSTPVVGGKTGAPRPTGDESGE